MPNKYHRQNFRMGSNPFGRKSNLQKIAEVFGPKKKDKKVKKSKTKRMFANAGTKPDFLDLDKDGNTSESMKIAAKQAKSGRIKRNQGGGADTGKTGEKLSNLGVEINQIKRGNKKLEKIIRKMKSNLVTQGKM